MDGVYTLAALPLGAPLTARLTPITGLVGISAVSLEAELKYGSGGSSCIVRVVSSFDGEHWWDLARIDFGTASAVKQCTVTDALVGISDQTPLGAEGVADRPLLGTMLAVAVMTTGTYANSVLVVRAAVRSGFVRPVPLVVAPPPTGFVVGMNLVDITSGGVTTNSEVDYVKLKGCTFVRLVFNWEQIQPTLLGALDPTVLGFLTNVVAYCQFVGLDCWLDLHNYARYRPAGSSTDMVLGGGTLGSDSGVLTTAHFNDVWVKLATAMAPYIGTVKYDLINEPHDMIGDGPTWTVYAQSAINAIRPVDPTSEILVEGYHFSNTYDWAGFNPDIHTLIDPANNLTFSGHMYPDPDDSGGGNGFNWDHCVSIGDLLDPGQPLDVNTGVKRLTPFFNWLATHGKRGNIGESGIAATFGVSDNINWFTQAKNTIDFCQASDVPFCAWAGGQFWGAYAYSLQPGPWISNTSVAESEQWALLSQYTGAAQPSVYFLTGPSNGAVSTPSSNFTVPYRGMLTAPVVVTPNDNGALGSFTPPSVTLLAGVYNPAPAFTYTPPAGAVTTRIDVTNSGGLANPPGIVFSTEVDLFAGIAIPQNIISDIQLFAPYIGPCRQMRRNSDGAIRDFGFAGQALGSANLGRTLDVAAIAAWAPAGATTVIRYSQEPVGNHMQPVTAQSASDAQGALGSAAPSSVSDYPAFSIDSDGFPTDTFTGKRMDLPSSLHGATGQTIIANYNFGSGSALLNWDFTSAIEFGPSVNQTCPETCVFTGSISGHTLTVDSIARGTLATNQFLNGPNVPAFTQIVSGSGSTWTINGAGASNSHVGMTTDNVDHATNEQGAMSLGTVIGEYHIHAATWQANSATGWRTWKDGTQFAANKTYASELTQDFNRSTAHLGWHIFIGPTVSNTKVRDLIVWNVAIPDANNVAIQNFLTSHYATIAPTSVPWDIKLDFEAGTYTNGGSPIAVTSVIGSGSINSSGLLNDVNATLIGAALAMVNGNDFTLMMETNLGPASFTGNLSLLRLNYSGVSWNDLYMNSSYVVSAAGAVAFGSDQDVTRRHRFAISRNSATSSYSAYANGTNNGSGSAPATGYTSGKFGVTGNNPGTFRITKLYIKAGNASTIQLLNETDIVGTPGAALPSWLPGVNIAGGAFGGGGFWQLDQSTDYYHGGGMKSLRLAFKWEEMQTSLNATISPTIVAHTDAIIAHATGLGMTVILDCHNGNAVYGGLSIGAAGGPTMANLVNLWGQLATRYASNPLVGFDLMNEPGGPLTLAQWYSGMQDCITAIRATGAAGLILIPSYGASSSPTHFVYDGNAVAFLAQGFTDSNCALTNHIYLDAGGGGSGSDAARYTGRNRCRTVIGWCRQHNVKFWLGEIGVSNSPNQPWGVLELGDMIAFLKQSNDVCLGYTYWAGGPAWVSNYFYLMEPVNPGNTGLGGWGATPYGERPQMGMMRMYL